MSVDHTSVPVWPDSPPSVDPAGRSYLVLSRGDAGGVIARGWAAEIERARKPLWVSHGDCATGWSPSLLCAQLEVALVGTRVMVAAPEIDVLDVLRAARAAGAVDAELRAFVTSSEQRRIQCPHCTAHSVATVAIGETVTCGGCGRTLGVHPHVSWLHGAYLGSIADVA